MVLPKTHNLSPTTLAAKQLKVLLSAYACEPHKGSEPGVGWNWAKQIAKFAEVWVITRANNREVIEEELKKNPDPNIHFIYIDLPIWLSFWKKKTRGLYLYYLLWQIWAYFTARSIHKRGKFDLVHHLTFGNMWLPTFMSFLNIPFIWGPIGGGEQVPKQFRKDYNITARLQERIRDLIVWSLKINPLFLYNCRKAVLIIARTKETLKKLPEFCKEKTAQIIETGIHILEHPAQRSAGEKNITILSVGRLIHLKGFDLGLQAFARVFKDQDSIMMVIIGDGPDKSRLQKICIKEKISDKVVFTGQLSREKVLNYMANGHVFLFPSLKEGGAWVLFEAMAAGLPIVCLEYGGPGEMVTDECGFKIKPVTPEQTIKDLADALLKLANDPELRKKMGEAGRRRVMEHYTWEKKGEFIRKIYEDVLGY